MRRFSFLIVFALLSLSKAMAYDFSAVCPSGQTLYYDINDDGVSVTVSECIEDTAGSLTIPSTVAFSDSSYTVTSIGYEAFDCCRGLTSVTIPNSVTSIGEEAFEHCTGLTSVTIPNSVTSIGDRAFAHCTGLTSVTIPNSVTSIGNSAFEFCTGLTSVTIPNSVTSIVDYTFAVCTGLTSVTIPNSVTSIGYRAFSGCEGLTSVTIPNSVTSIGDGAFSWCEGLTSVTIPNSVTSIGNSAFEFCTGLTSVTIPNSVTSIGNSAFWGCTGLTSVTIPNSVTSIGYGAFAFCTGLTSVTIPNSVTSIGYRAFLGCEGLTSISVDANNTHYDSRNNCNAIVETATNILIAGCKNTVIPNGVTSIGDYAFDHCTGLTSVTIPNSVTSIGYRAFDCCSGLTSVTIPNSVTSIGDYAFELCTGLTSVTIPNSVTSIGDWAFFGCEGLTSVTIPNSVTSIGDWAFAYCIGLQSMRSECLFPPIISDNTFYNSSKGIPLYIPCGSKADYQRDPVWGTFFNLIDECEYTIYVVSADEAMGTVSGGGEYYDGDIATLVATPLSGYQFSHWNDGNTDNPRNVTVTADTTFTAYFAPGTGVESITESSNEIYSCNGQIVITGAEDAIIRIFDMMGRLVCTTNATSNPQSIPVNASGVYMVQVDNKPAQRVVLIR